MVILRGPLAGGPCHERLYGAAPGDCFDGSVPKSATLQQLDWGGKIMADEIGTGSVVKLKSGGPKMTVEAVFRDAGGRMCVRCTWFDDTKRTSQAFELEAVEIA